MRLCILTERKMRMKKQLKLILCTAAAAFTALTAALTASAEDVMIDVSDAKEATGWQQSVTIKKETFDARRLSKKSTIKVAFDAGDYAGEEAPVELIFQSWDNTTSPNADEEGAVWARVAPSEFTEASAVFTYDAIVEAYGTDDFSQVMAICIGDTDLAPITVKAVQATECAMDMGVMDVTIDCSEAKDSAHFAQSIVVDYSVFDMTRLTKESEIVVKYTTNAEDEASLKSSPIQIIIFCENNSNSPYAKDNGSAWITVEPESFKEGRAVFKYQAIVDAYGTADFSRVTSMKFGDTGDIMIKVTNLSILNCVSEDKGTHVAAESADDSSGEDSSSADESSSETESKTDESSSTADSAAATADSDKEDKGGSNITMVVIGIIAGVVLAVVVVFIILTKQSSQEYDIDKRHMVSKKKPKNKTKW